MNDVNFDVILGIHQFEHEGIQIHFFVHGHKMKFPLNSIAIKEKEKKKENKIKEIIRYIYESE